MLSELVIPTTLKILPTKMDTCQSTIGWHVFILDIENPPQSNLLRHKSRSTFMIKSSKTEPAAGTAAGVVTYCNVNERTQSPVRTHRAVQKLSAHQLAATTTHLAGPCMKLNDRKKLIIWDGLQNFFCFSAQSFITSSLTLSQRETSLSRRAVLWRC